MTDAQKLVQEWISYGEVTMKDFKARPRSAGPPHGSDRYWARVRIKVCRRNMPAEARKHFIAKEGE